MENPRRNRIKPVLNINNSRNRNNIQSPLGSPSSPGHNSPRPSPISSPGPGPIKSPVSPINSSFVNVNNRRGYLFSPPNSPINLSRNFVTNNIGERHPELRQQLQKPCSSLFVSKFRAVRNEFLTKAKNLDEKDFSILHFAFWNPKTPKTQPMRKNPPEEEEKEEIVTKQREESLGPQVKVGLDGSLIVDEQSLLIQTSESLSGDKLNSMETVNQVFLKRNYRKRRKAAKEWGQQETIKFYKGLSKCGSDFSMLSTLFPGRSRDELKAKFKREDGKYPSLVSRALNSAVFDVKHDNETDLT